MNPFSMGKIVGIDYYPALYHQMEGGKRGTDKFIMSRSELMEFQNCPRRWLLGVEDHGGDKATDFGSLVDCIITQPKALKNLFAVIPREYTNEEGETKPWNFNSTTCKKWKAQHEGKTLVKDTMMLEALQSQARLDGDERIHALINSSQKQVCVTTLYKGQNGIIVGVKALIDLVPDPKGPHGDCLGDLKTARNAAPNEWEKTVFKLSYHVQAALYLDAYNSCPNVQQRTGFLHCIVENIPPFETARRILSNEFIEIGREKYLKALHRYTECLKTGVWSGYDDEGNDLVDGWRLTQPQSYMIL